MLRWYKIGRLKSPNFCPTESKYLPPTTAPNCSLGGRTWIICYMYGATFSSTYIWRNVLFSSRKKTGHKQENLVLPPPPPPPPHVFVCIHCRYRLRPKISLVTDFRSPMFDSVAPLNMVMSADPPISVTEKVRACSYILKLLSQMWKQQTEIPYIYARNVQEEKAYLSCSFWSV